MRTQPLVIGVASSGGHLIQMESLVRLGVPINHIMSPDTSSAASTYTKIPDCNIKSPVQVVACLVKLVKELSSVRPDIIISTGAAPGGLAVVVGKFIGAKTVWIDSIANTERASLTGRMAKPFCDLWISQWENVAKQNKGLYFGKIFNFFDRGHAASV